MKNYSIGERIRAWRTKLKISQEQLALKAEITPAYLGQIERGEKNPTVKIVERLADVLGVPLAELFTDRNAEPVLLSAERDLDFYEQQIIFEIQPLNEKEKAELLRLVKSAVKLVHLAKYPPKI